MNKVWKVFHKGKEILVLDYSGCKTPEMIEIGRTAKQLMKAENKHVVTLSILKNNHLTPEFMRFFEKEIKEVEHLIDKNAITGLTEIQKWILKGVNLWYKRQIHHFDSYEEALEFLSSND
jgi:hypothetical protein